MRACLSLYCVTGFSFGWTKLTTLFALVSGRVGGGLFVLTHGAFQRFVCSRLCCLTTARLAYLMCVMFVLKRNEAASGFTDKVETLALQPGKSHPPPLETSSYLVCGQLFAPQSNGPSEMQYFACGFPWWGPKSGSATKQWIVQLIEICSRVPQQLLEPQSSV